MNTDMRNIRISAVILASGMSTRMGTPKQLIMFKGVPLLEYIIRRLLNFPFHKIQAVIGHKSEEIMRLIKINDLRFEWNVNNDYQEGQSAALKQAVRTIGKVEGMMVFLADQPLILDETIGLLLKAAETQLANHEQMLVVQPSFLGIKGHPVFFTKRLFPYFETIRGDEGGKRVIDMAQIHHVISVRDQGILFDIDTPEDYQLLLGKKRTDTYLK